MAQRDPLVEYQREGGDMFNRMKEGIKEETVRQLFLVRKQMDQAQSNVNVQDPAAGTDSDEDGRNAKPQTTIGG